MAQTTVNIQDMAFDPDPVKIKVGDSIVWSNEDSMNHTATANDGSFNTGMIPKKGKSKPITFSKAGSVPYYCKVHGEGMSGTVQVS
jgi:plastocyanin